MRVAGPSLSRKLWAFQDFRKRFCPLETSGHQIKHCVDASAVDTVLSDAALLVLSGLPETPDVPSYPKGLFTRPPWWPSPALQLSGSCGTSGHLPIFGLRLHKLTVQGINGTTFRKDTSL